MRKLLLLAVELEKFPDYAVFMVKAIGENGKVSRISNLRMELRSKSSYTGTKQLELVEKSIKLNDF